MSSSSKYLRVSGPPQKFSGTVKLPASKSYLHRGLFVSALAQSESALTGCGTETNDDIQATIKALSQLGAVIKSTRSAGGTIRVSKEITNSREIMLDAGGSGTTARFLIPFASLSEEGTVVRISGNGSLSRRPMGTIFEPLQKLGVNAKSLSGDGKLPVIVEGGGMRGGECEVDGSTSSQFVSSLLISCVKSRGNCTVSIKNPGAQVSVPYIDSTLRMMSVFGYKIEAEKSETGNYKSFKIRGNQTVPGRRVRIPGDMSSAAALIAATVAARGRLHLTNFGDKRFPQPDSSIIPIARSLGARVKVQNSGVWVISSNRKVPRHLSFDLRNSPDLVPAVAGLAAATGAQIHLSNIAHLRFKESDRISVVCRELSKLGVRTDETDSTLEVLGDELIQPKKNILINPDGDHRILMAFVIAGLSGRFGSFGIEDPDCVRKSYPSFVADLQKLCHEKSTLKIVNKRNSESRSEI
jgi:3-phosphoshikimate 1-carboxyvinyltransferase